ncbi:MAG: ATP-binding protein, partial [Pseudomonadota bacterium]
VRVKEERGGDEISILSRSFNRMASELKGQRDALLDANLETERRRRLTEAVLSGVTAGVVGLDGAGEVDMVNDAAATLLDIDPVGSLGRPLGEVAPAFLPLMDHATRGPSGIGQGEVRVVVAGQPREFLCRVALKAPEAQEEGHVLTFDDITALGSAQRMAAWGDVARRIAHEIKNPLTPIQLSADRMRRKFAGRLGEDGAKLEQMLDVITRQAGEIRRMVDEFSRFARMPEPVMHEEDLGQLVRDAVLLQEHGHGGEHGIAYQCRLPDGPVPVLADRGLLGQCLTNLLQNAADAVEGRREALRARDPEVAADYRGRIRVSVSGARRDYRIDIADNGVGLPAEGRDRLTDPYVTTRKKGTGLGLAIVQKILEQHGGSLALGDTGPESGLDGAQVTLRLPRPVLRSTGEGEGCAPNDTAKSETTSKANSGADRVWQTS